jgi:diguanylate cyclase (GGDEF)-like protein
MLKLLPWSCLISMLSIAAVAHGQGQAPLTQVRQINQLTNAQAANSLPVRLRATVTYASPEDGGLFVQSDGLGTYVNYSGQTPLSPGDQVLITGVTDASFRPEVTASQVEVLAHGNLPLPKPATFEDLIQSRFDSQYVSIRGHVIAAATRNPGLRLQVAVPHGIVAVHIAHPGNLRTEDMLDAEVSLTGVAGGEFDSRMQLAGVSLDVNSATQLTLVHPPVSNPWNLPLVPLDQVVYAFRDGNQSQRVRVAGTLIYYEGGEVAVIEQNGQGILVETDTFVPMQTGDSVEAIGFPAIVDQNVRLERAQLRSLQEKGTATPHIVDWEHASQGKFAYELVAMEGEVVAQVHDARVDLLILKHEKHLFSVTLRHSSSDFANGAQPSPLPDIGSQVRVTGVCFVDAGNHWQDRLWFDLRMRSLSDIAVLQQPPWWTVQRMTYVVTALSAIILVAVIWVGMLDKRLRSQTAILARQSQEDAIRERQLARLEQQRSHILERISSSAPLNDVLREIQVLVTSRLFGASCAFELHSADGKVQQPSDTGVIFRELFLPDGSSLGYLTATPLAQRVGESDIASTLEIGARLAELAIDTRRLYSDLHHRSEYDLLTDIPNRFSMEKKLNDLMAGGRRNEGVFGLIYVDLDHFKQVNDRYGHRIGDLYLQESTRRMKLQLRNGDMLARIGGDEFIALVPILRSRADAEEIVHRIERCFDEPFNLEGYQLHGAASIGLAVYPEDGANQEDLQRWADSAMYAHKQEKRQQETPLDEKQPR